MSLVAGVVAFNDGAFEKTEFLSGGAFCAVDVLVAGGLVLEHLDGGHIPLTRLLALTDDGHKRLEHERKRTFG